MDRTPDTVAAVNWDELEREAVAAYESAASGDELEEVHVRYLGRKAALPQALRGVRDRESGMTLNAVRRRLEEAEEAAHARLDGGTVAGDYDVTLPGDAPPRGHLHLITQIRREVEDVFLGLGYEVVDGREVETTHYNFDALNFPDWHPARSTGDSFFLDDTRVLRTETSPSQIRTMEERGGPPIYMITTGRVYRRENVDATHTQTFHQVEGLAIDEGITLADLKGTLLAFMRAIFGPERRVRFRTHYFPFTEPSIEPDVSCFLCDGVGCAVCKHSGWLEMGGSGMVDPALFEFVDPEKYDPEKVSGFAFGLGLERIALLRHGLPDIRLLWGNDLRVLGQFR